MNQTTGNRQQPASRSDRSHQEHKTFMATGTTNDTTIARQTYTVPEVATILGIGRNTAYEICRTGEIPTIKIGGRVLVPRSAIDELLNGAKE